jgi:hypothetical protein
VRVFIDMEDAEDVAHQILAIAKANKMGKT